MYVTSQGLEAMQNEHVRWHLCRADEKHLVRMAEQERRSATAPGRDVARHPVLALHALVHKVLGAPTGAKLNVKLLPVPSIDNYEPE